MRVEDMIKNAEKFQKELGEGEFSGSPWNSPQAQHTRLADARVHTWTHAFGLRGRLSCCAVILSGSFHLFHGTAWSTPPSGLGCRRSDRGVSWLRSVSFLEGPA